MSDSRKKGFTLVELMVVLLLLSLLTSVIAISFSQAEGLRWKDFKSALKNLDQELRDKSKSLNQKVELRVQASERTFEGQVNGKPIPGGVLRFPRKYELKSFLVGKEFKRQQGVVFNSSGESSDYSLVFTNPEKMQSVVFVIGISGQIQEFENEGNLRSTIKEIQGTDSN